MGPSLKRLYFKSANFSLSDPCKEKYNNNRLLKKEGFESRENVKSRSNITISCGNKNLDCPFRICEDPG